MLTVKGKIVEGGRVILPAAFRRSLGLAKGDTVLIELHDDELRVRPARAALRRLQAKLRALDPAEALASDELVAERRAEAAREGGGSVRPAEPEADAELGADTEAASSDEGDTASEADGRA